MEYSIVDQELKNYCENLIDKSLQQADAVLDQLVDRYNLTSDNTDGFFETTLLEILNAQTKAQNQLIQDQRMSVESDKSIIRDGKLYKLSTQSQILIGDKAYNPLINMIMDIDEENVDHANEEYFLVLSVEDAPEPKEFNIQVCRTGYGFANIKVKAHTREEAEELAIENAGDYTYNESDAEYTIS